MQSNPAYNKQELTQLKEHLPFAKAIYQTIVEEWILQNINVEKVRKAFREKNISSAEEPLVYSIKPNEVVKRTYENYNTHTFAIPSIGLYLFPQTEKPFHTIFKLTEKLFKKGQLMASIKANSNLIDKMSYVFEENGFNFSSTVGDIGELKIEIRSRKRVA